MATASLGKRNTDLATLLGLAAGFVVVGAAIVIGGSAMAFIDLPSVLIVIGGTFAVTMICFSLSDVLNAIRAAFDTLVHHQADPARAGVMLLKLADKARRDGILALENEIEKIDDPFLSKGLRMAVDGTDEEIIETTLRLEVMAMQERHKAGKKFFDIIKVYAPCYGLVATLIGQVGMFGNLGGDIQTLGHMLAIAVVATMYGTVLANAVAGPMGDKLALRSSEEILSREMMLQGILSIQAGDNPRATQEKMLAFIPNTVRRGLKMAA